MFRLLLQELRFRRNAMIGWGIGLCFFPAVYVGIYPEFADQLAGFQDLLDLAIYQAMGISFAGFEEYVASTVTNFIPVLLCIFAVINSTNTLAGEEDDGRLELIVALPIPRWQIVTVKAIAIGISLFVTLAIVGLGSALTLLSIESQVETAVSATDLFLNVLSAWPIVMAIAMISLFLGTFTPSKRIASILATVVVVVSYFGSNMAGLLTSLENLQKVFLFYYFDATADGLINGQETGNVLIILAVVLVAFVLALFFFQRRDITVGQWPWQRARAN